MAATTAEEDECLCGNSEACCGKRREGHCHHGPRLGYCPSPNCPGASPEARAKLDPPQPSEAG